jgi:DNA-binding response OmpR family regulator
MSVVAADPRARVLVIDDDHLYLEIMEYHLERRGYAVEVAEEPRKGLNQAIDGDFDVILLDLMMPGMSGEEVLGLLKPLSLKHRVVVVSAHSADEYQARTRDLGAVAYIQKPAEPDHVCALVEDLLRGGARPDGDPAGGPEPRDAADRLAAWVFENGEVTKLKRAAAFGLVVLLLGVVVWLLVG